jgi:hypothetical protein
MRRWTKKTFGLAVAVGLSMSGAAVAEPLQELRGRLAALHSDRPIRIEVEVTFDHLGTAPLHLNAEKRRGTADLRFNAKGKVKSTQRWHGGATRFSVWGSGRAADESSTPLLDTEEAWVLVDPAGTLDLLLRDAVLLDDRTVTWRERPARLLVIRPGLFAGRDEQGRPADGPRWLTQEAKIWLDENGDPLALERSLAFDVGPLHATQHQVATFQQVDGRLLVADADEVFTGSALIAFNGADHRTLRVKVR